MFIPEGSAGIAPQGIQFELDGRQVEAAPRRDHLAGRQTARAAKFRICAIQPEPGYRPDGNCRACMVEIEGERVLAASCKRKPSVGMKVKIVKPARRSRAEDGDGAAGRRPAGAPPRTIPIRNSGTGPIGRRDRKPFSGAERWPATASHPAMRGQSRRLHPVQSVRARLPRGPGQRRDRHGGAQCRRQDRVRFRRSDGRISTCVACGECVQACPTGALMASMLDEADPRHLLPTGRSIRSARIAASAARSPIRSRTRS
jgi:formate dehydrogenase major subunit